MALETRGPSCIHLGLWLKGGAGADPPGKAGLAHLYEHLFFQPERAVSRSLLGDLESFGGEPWAATFGDCVRVGLSLPPEGFDLAVRVLADLFGPREWSARAVRREAAAIAVEAGERDDDPAASTVFGAVAGAYSGIPFAPRLADERTEVRLLHPADLESLRASVHPTRVILGVAGPSAGELCDRAAEALFRVLDSPSGACAGSRRAPGDDASEDAFSVELGPAAPPAPRVAVRRRRLDQPHLCLAFRLPDRREGRQAAFEVLDSHLCQGVVPPLVRQLRETAGVYDVTAEFDFWRFTVLYVLYTSCAVGATGRVLAAVAGALKRVRTVPPDADDLRRAKARRRVRFLTHVESPLMALRWAGAGAVALGRPVEAERWLRELENVTRDDLAAAADWLLGSPPALCAAGPVPTGPHLVDGLRLANERWVPA